MTVHSQQPAQMLTAPTSRASAVWSWRCLGAFALLAVAADHLYEYDVDHYSAIPTIGTLFLLNGIGAVSLAFLLVAPWDRLLRAGYATVIRSAAAAAGVGLAATSLAGLFISE